MDNINNIDVAVISLLLATPLISRSFVFNKYIMPYRYLMSNWIFEELKKEY